MKAKLIPKNKTFQKRPDLFLLVATVLLVMFGLLMIYNASPVTSLRDFGDPTRLAGRQVIWALGGTLAAIFFYKFPYKLLEKLAPLILLGVLLLLLLVFIPAFSISTYGAARWLGVGNLFSIQPSEFAKLAYIIYLAAFLTKKVKFGPFVALTGFLVLLLILQRDLGTAIVISFIGLFLYFLSGAPLFHFLILIPSALLFGAIFILSESYRRERFLTFLNPTTDTEKAAYHINQILIALGSGGWLGVGLGQSRQKYGYIPEVATDSIFAVIGNEIGFLGSLIFIGLLFLIVFRAFKIAERIPDKFGQFLAGGIGFWIGVQVFVNLAGMVALIPLTGIPLPFISYGGSALFSVLVAIGILLQLSKNRQK